MIKAGILGATGYAGEQLVWILRKHPMASIEFYASHNYANLHFADIYNNYYDFIKDKCIDMEEAESRLSEVDVIFIALPHGKSFDIAKKALSLGVKVIDLGADFRLNTAETYREWYGIQHGCPELLKEAVYGISELKRNEIKGCSLLANPGCYPTATMLGLAPLLSKGLIDTGSIIVDAKSGVSGAGRSANISSLFTECNESIKAYGVTVHRHTPEIEQELSSLAGESIRISFTPHLVPMNRGILSTCYGNLKKEFTTETLLELYREFYRNDHFVKVIDGLPETRWVRGSNLCHVGLRVDKRTNRVVVMSVIDNLVKGAAGQAVQNMNLMFGFEETEGLEFISMAP